jgi:hypothetical protein
MNTAPFPWYSVEYSSFSIGPESSFYVLQVSGYSGDSEAGNALQIDGNYGADGRPFSTYDSDHDNQPSGSCAVEYSGGWWFNWCSASFLNDQGSAGASWTKLHTVQSSRMMIRLNT